MSKKKLSMEEEANRRQLMRRRAKKKARRDGSMGEDSTEGQAEQGSHHETSQMEG